MVKSVEELQILVRHTSNSLKPVVRPSVSPSIRQNHLWAQMALQPSSEARKKPPVGGLNFLVSI